jgi:hypothetical protein
LRVGIHVANCTVMFRMNSANHLPATLIIWLTDSILIYA